jgi:hypothetical protein
VAYTSDESQVPEIYVAPFTRPAEKHQISLNGGTRPRWRQDGKEIFFVTPSGRLMAAEVRISSETVEVGAVHALFDELSLVAFAACNGREQAIQDVAVVSHVLAAACAGQSLHEGMCARTRVDHRYCMTRSFAEAAGIGQCR